MRTFACLGHVEAEASDWEMAVLDLLLHVRGYFFADLRGWTFGEKAEVTSEFRASVLVCT